MTLQSTSSLSAHGLQPGNFTSAHGTKICWPVFFPIPSFCCRRPDARAGSSDAKRVLTHGFPIQIAPIRWLTHGRKDAFPACRAKLSPAVDLSAVDRTVELIAQGPADGRSRLRRTVSLRPYPELKLPQRQLRPRTVEATLTDREPPGVQRHPAADGMRPLGPPARGAFSVGHSLSEPGAPSAGSSGTGLADVGVGGASFGLTGRWRAAEPTGGRERGAPYWHQHQQPRQVQPQLRQGSTPAGELPELEAEALKTGLALTWLGTNSGTPTLERNVSCTLVRMPGAVQMVDCGEGTHRQLMEMRGLDSSEVDGIFITHLHGDHCFGLGATLELLDEVKAARQTDPARRRNHVYGPPGLAELLRASLLVTGLSRRLQLPLTVTELVCSPSSAHSPRPLADYNGHNYHDRLNSYNGYSHQQEQQQTSGWGWGSGKGGGAEVMVQRIAAKRIEEVTELQNAARAVGPRLAALQEIWTPPPRHLQYGHFFQFGRVRQGGSSRSGTDFNSETADLYSSIDEDLDEINAGGSGGTARRRYFVAADGLFWDIPGCAGVRVRAAQLQHRIACWGYVFQEVLPYEPEARRRKVVVLGDTVSSRPIAALAAGCDVLAHEATFARGMEEKARIAQHSTGWMAGAFAAAVGARSLVLTHFSSRYREGGAWDNQQDGSVRIVRATARMEADQQAWAVAGLLQEAARTYGRREHVFAASDFYTHHVPLWPSAVAGSGAGEGEEKGAGGVRGGAGLEHEGEQGGGSGRGSGGKTLQLRRRAAAQ